MRKNTVLAALLFARTLSAQTHSSSKKTGATKQPSSLIPILCSVTTLDVNHEYWSHKFNVDSNGLALQKAKYDWNYYALNLLGTKFGGTDCAFAQDYPSYLVSGSIVDWPGTLVLPNPTANELKASEQRSGDYEKVVKAAQQQHRPVEPVLELGACGCVIGNPKCRKQLGPNEACLAR